MDALMDGAVEFLRGLSAQGIRLSVEGGELKCYAPRGRVTEAVRSGIGFHRSSILALFASRKGVESKASVVREFSLSAGQKGLYLLHELSPGLSSYNVPVCLRLSPGVRVEALSRAWSWVQDRYPILTARVKETDGVLSQILDEGCRTNLALQWLEGKGEAELLGWLRDRAREPFDLRRGPLARADLLLGGEGGPVLLLTVHHFVFDGTSALLVLRALVQYYGEICGGRSTGPVPGASGYEAFVAWEEAMLTSAEGVGHGAYWQRQLSGELPVLELLSEPRHGDAARRGARRIEDLPEDLHRWVQAYGATLRLAPSVIFLGVFQLLLHRYTGQDDIIVGMPVMGRTEERFAGEVGYYVNMVPLRTHISPSSRLSDSLLGLRSTMLDGLYHSSYPFPLMVEKLLSRPSGRHPVFQVAYAYQNFVRAEDFATLSRQEGFSLEVMTGVGQEGDFDFALEVFEKERSVSLHLKYNPALYSEAVAQGFLSHYQSLLRAIRENPDRLTQEYAITTDVERSDVLLLGSGLVSSYRSDVSVGDVFTDRVLRQGSSLALVFGEERLSYGELYGRSVDLALYLQSLGVGADSVVGLFLERSVDLVVGILGVELAGGAYLPLDPSYPDDRLEYMLSDSGALVVLSQSHLSSRLGVLLEEEVRHLRLDGDWEVVREGAAELRCRGVSLVREAGPETLSYVIYTSGSTGRPKGVEVEHRALMNRLQWMQKRYGLEVGEVVLQKTPYSFDVSVWEFFWPLLEGATLVLAAPEGHKDVIYLESLIAREGVTTLHFVPPMLRVYLETARGQSGSVRRVFCSGESLDVRSVEQYRSRFPNAELHNLYGPTEAAIDVTSFACSTLQGEVVPIGRPIDNIQMHVLDAWGHLQPVGVPGELYIAGDGLARGYRNNPILTAEKFVANPFCVGTRMYRTGDLARWLEDGNLQYLGRIDTQVKLRGFRIELGEIEACLNQYAGVEDSVVILRERGEERDLVAFYRTKPTDAGQVAWLDMEALKGHVGQHLPEYMIPTGYVSLAEIPLTASGKADRRALAKIEVKLKHPGRNDYVAPGREMERRMVEIWAQLLGLEAEGIGIHDNFFELGGHSLLATQLQARLRGMLGVELPLRTLFEKPTVAGLAEAVVGAEVSRAPHIVPADRNQKLPLSFSQERLWFYEQLSPGTNRYNVPGAVVLRGELNVDHLEEALQHIVARHEVLRTSFPSLDGQARQQIKAEARFRLRRVELDPLEGGREERIRELCRAEAMKPFNLAMGPLIRGMAISLSAEEHVLMLNMHHIISDGWSLRVLVSEIRQIMEALREGSKPHLPPLPIQYADYAIWQRRWLIDDGILQKQLDYWKQKLGGAPENLGITTDYQRPAVQSFAGSSVEFFLDIKTTEALRHLADRRGCTLFMALIAAFKVLLYRYTKQQDVCVGTLVANRHHSETEGLIGMFVNTLALRDQLDPENTYLALLSQVKKTSLEAYEHQDTPFEKVVECLQEERNAAFNPVFQVMLVLHGNGDLSDKYARFEFETDSSELDLIFQFRESGGCLSGSLEYSTSLYRSETALRMCEHFVGLCRSIVEAPRSKIYALEYMSDVERSDLLLLGSGLVSSYRSDVSVGDVFTDRVLRQGSSLALVFGEERLSYGELYGRSVDLALYLQSLGVGADSVVGLFLERSVDLVVGILGVELAGGAYLPLDPSYPDDRLEYMLSDSGALVVLSQSHLSSRLGVLLEEEVRHLRLDGDWEVVREGAAELRCRGVSLVREAGPETLSYVIYTSGSTGRPKGVEVEHRALMNRLQWMQKRYGLEVGEVVLQKTPYSFDVSVWEFFWPLLEGATLVLAAPEGHKDVIYLESLIAREGVTTLHFVPPMLRVYLETARGQSGSVRRVFCSGESLDVRSVEQYRSRFPNAELHNLYGPTEAAIDVTSFACSTLQGEVVPIGRPIDNIQMHVLDAWGHLQPVGVPGELYIAGDGLARGYRNNPVLTAEKFVANPFCVGTRMYRTGDLARWLEDGNLQYLGRIDTQVKLRGFQQVIPIRERDLTDESSESFAYSL